MLRSDFEHFTIAVDVVLQPGTNHLAFELHNRSMTSGDAGFGLRVNAVVQEPSWSAADFDADGDADHDDVDSLVMEIDAGTHTALFDSTRDAEVDGMDLTRWLSIAATHNGFGEAYLLGDANLDGAVNSVDLNSLALNWQQDVALWSSGDFTANGVVDSADLNVLALSWQHSTPMASSANVSVPEPSVWMLLAGLALIWRRPRCS